MTGHGRQAPVVSDLAVVMMSAPAVLPAAIRGNVITGQGHTARILMTVQNQHGSALQKRMQKDWRPGGLK